MRQFITFDGRASRTGRVAVDHAGPLSAQLDNIDDIAFVTFDLAFRDSRYERWLEFS